MITFTIQSVHGLSETFVVGPTGTVDTTKPQPVVSTKEPTMSDRSEQQQSHSTPSPKQPR